ncbi:unnamed protein product [Gemmataceae bacterium]|jgi:hypothetical protein|nr:unnamed protein product [Gemmataceae bacterium]VTT97950.1 unnamed protein product [Gemmataceae bacterium]
MAKKSPKPKPPAGPRVRWSDDTVGVLTCARLDGPALRVELVRGDVPVSLTLEPLGPDFYAGRWASAGANPAQGSASVAVTRGVHDVCRLAGRWFEGSAVVTWTADGVTIG